MSDPSETSETVTTHAADQTRFEAHVDGELAGVLEYQLADGVVVLPRTEVDPAFEGLGVGSALARTALDTVRAGADPFGERRVVASCPFVERWIDKHPEYADLLHDGPA